jgi:PAS domain S-box-containing protein
MDDGGKTRKELLLEVERLQSRLAAADRDHQILMAHLRDEHRLAETEWRRRIEALEAKLAEPSSEERSPHSCHPGESYLQGCERQRLLDLVQNQAEELQAANEELTAQAEELQEGNEELTIQAEELRTSNEELLIQAGILEEQKVELGHQARELETQRALLMSVLEQMPASVLIAAAPDGPLWLSNQLANQIWDSPLQDLSDLETFWQIPRHHPDGRVYRKEEMPLWRSLHLGEVILDEEFSLRPKGRFPIRLSVNSAPVRDNQGCIVAGVVTHFDITARKSAEQALKESEARFRGLFECMTEGVALHEVIYDDQDTAVDYRILATNPAFAVHTGLQPDQIHGQLSSDAYGAGEAPFLETYARVAQTGEPASFEIFFPPLKRHFHISVTSPRPGQFVTVFEDISGRKAAEAERELVIRILGLVNASTSLHELTREFTEVLQAWSGCEAVGLRLRQGEDFPYFETRGFPAEFVKMENSLCVRNRAGELQRDNAGNAVLECMCGNVICGRFNPELAFFTPGGSFWTNSTTQLLASTTVEDRQARTRNRCHGEGYESVALVPLKSGQEALGLLQFNDRTPGKFTWEKIQLFERLADSLASGMARRQVEEALRESEERYRSLFENEHAVMLLVDPETGAIMNANPAACIYYGYSREELLAQKITDINTLSPEEVFQEMQRARSEQRKHFEFRHRLASGKIRDVEVFSGPIRIKGRELLYSIVHDDTARKQAEEALQRAHDELEQRVKERTTELRDTVAQLIEEVQERQRAEASLRKQAQLLELAQEAIIVRDLDSRVVFWNRGAEEAYGWPRKQAEGQVIHNLLKTRFPASREEVDQDLFQTGQWYGELVHSRADGEEIVVASRMVVQRNDEGVPVAILEVNRDVTARRRAEEALKTERQRLLSVLERIPAHVALLRPDHGFAYVNGEFIRRFGDPGSKSCYEVAGQQHPCKECQAIAVFQTEQPVGWEWTGPDSNIYQMYDYPFIDVDGSPLVLEMGVDITARKRAEEQAASLSRMYRMLSKANETIVRVTGKDELFRRICRLMMEEGDFRLAWIGQIDQDTRLVKAGTKYDLADEYVQNITIPVDDVPEGRGPTGTAAREGRYDVCNDIATDPRMAPWREQALARGFQASAAFPLKVGSEVVGVLTVYADRVRFFTPDEIALLESLADDLSFALEFLARDAQRRLVEEILRESEERLRYLASQLLHAQEKERRHLALELHDDLGQSLMVLKMQLRTIEKTVPPEQWRSKEECAHTLNYLNVVIDNVRRLARNLRPSVLDDLGLAAGLRVLGEEFCKYHEIELSLEMDDIEGLFSRDEEINLYRIFQETLTNIAKHAQASKVGIVIRRSPDGVSFQVTDDGVGFDLDQVLVRDAAKKGLGLAALDERVRILGGALMIKAQEHRGTAISFTVPSTGKRCDD